MNEFTHFLTGYLVGRAFKRKVDRFECLFVACCAFLPDLDYVINMFIPFEHGVWSHTFLVGSLFVLGFAVFTYFFNKPLLQKTGTKFLQLFLMGFLGLASHFLLDSFTWHPGPCSIWLNPALLPPECTCPGPTCFSEDDLHHLFFWPLWNFPPHINTLFPYEWVTYDVRVWVEVIYTVIIAGIVVLRLLFKHENFFGVLSPNRWWKHVDDASGTKISKAPPRHFIWLFLVAFIFTFSYWGGPIVDWAVF